jgi:hypothetical protein
MESNIHIAFKKPLRPKQETSYGDLHRRWIKSKTIPPNFLPYFPCRASCARRYSNQHSTVSKEVRPRHQGNQASLPEEFYWGRELQAHQDMEPLRNTPPESLDVNDVTKAGETDNLDEG